MDISSLLAELQDEQAKKSSARLSDRNVVELVLKLKQLGLFGDELLHTINGKEYITTDRLKADIQTALRQAGGRLELTELPALVGVDLVHCEKQAALIVEESGGSVMDAQGELITTQYFDSLAAEVNDMLQESGVLSLADLAVSYALNTELLRGQLSTRVGGTIRGALEGGLLHTPAYVRNIKARLRGALRGTAAPVALGVLAKTAGLDQGGGGHSMLASLAEELVAEGAVAGSTRGGGGSWVPSVHTAAQQAAVEGFYGQNGWVAYELVRRAGISGEKAYLAGKYPDGLALASVFVSRAILAQAEASVDEALGAGGWLDVGSVLPSALTPADVVQLLERCGDVAKDGNGKLGQVVAGTCVVSASLITGARTKMEEFAKAEADKVLQGRRASGAAAAAAASAGGPNGAAAAGEGGKPGSNGAPAKKDTSGADSDDDWSMGGGKKGKKGKGGAGSKGKGGGKAAAGGSGSGGGAQGKQGKGEADVNSLLSVGILSQLVLDLYPDMEDAGSSGSLAKALAELVRPAAVAAYQEALASVFTSGAVARKKARETALRALEEAFALLQLYAQGTELLQDDEATLVAMQRHLLRSTGCEALDALLSWCAQEFAEQEPAVAELVQQQQQQGAAAAAGSSSWTPGERTKLIKVLPPEVGPPLAKAVEAAAGTDPQELLAKLEAAASDCGIRLRRLDKKSEKAALTAHKARLMQLLHAEAAPAAVLALALPLLVLKVCGRLVSIPGRAIGGVLAMLQPQLEDQEGQFDLVQAFHEGVVASLRAAGGGGGTQSGSSEGAAAGEGQSQEQQALLVLLEGQVQQIKALVGVDAAASG